MKLLFLRGQVPTDRSPKEIMYEKISDIDDMWIRLAIDMVHEECITTDRELEIWYWGGKRKHKYAPHITERWIPDFKKHRSKFEPDVIFCRGGFKEYHCVLNRYPNALKIYYGAGKRFLPQKGYIDYDIILVDSERQAELARKMYQKPLVTTWIKPALDGLFRPLNLEKKYDCCFVAIHPKDDRKNVKWVHETIPNNISVLQLGNACKVPKNVNIKVKKVHRQKMPKAMSKCRVGIVPYTKHDSAPRVIPEFLACGIPVIIMDTCRHNNQMGQIASKSAFWDAVKLTLENLKTPGLRNEVSETLSGLYYMHYNIPAAAKHLINLIGSLWHE